MMTNDNGRDRRETSFHCVESSKMAHDPNMDRQTHDAYVKLMALGITHDTNMLLCDLTHQACNVVRQAEGLTNEQATTLLRWTRTSVLMSYMASMAATYGPDWLDLELIQEVQQIALKHEQRSEPEDERARRVV